MSLNKERLNNAIDVLTKHLGSSHEILPNPQETGILMLPHFEIDHNSLKELGIKSKGADKKLRAVLQKFQQAGVNALTSEAMFIANPVGLQEELRQERMDPARRMAGTEEVMEILRSFGLLEIDSLKDLRTAGVSNTRAIKGPSRNEEEALAVQAVMIADSIKNKNPLYGYELRPKLDTKGLGMDPLALLLGKSRSAAGYSELDPLLGQPETAGKIEPFVPKIHGGHDIPHDFIMRNPELFEGGQRYTHNPRNIMGENQSANQAKGGAFERKKSSPKTTESMFEKVISPRITEMVTRGLPVEESIRHFVNLQEQYPKLASLLDPYLRQLEGR